MVDAPDGQKHPCFEIILSSSPFLFYASSSSLFVLLRPHTSAIFRIQAPSAQCGCRVQYISAKLFVGTGYYAEYTHLMHSFLFRVDIAGVYVEEEGSTLDGHR